MPYDRLGRTTEMARRERAQERLTIIVLGLTLAAIAAIAALVVAVIGS